MVSTYFSHAVCRGLIREKILAAPTDSPVLQGRLAMGMAVRAPEGRLAVTQAGPPIMIVVPQTANRSLVAGSLAPGSFVPVLSLPAGAP